MMKYYFNKTQISEAEYKNLISRRWIKYTKCDLPLCQNRSMTIWRKSGHYINVTCANGTITYYMGREHTGTWFYLSLHNFKFNFVEDSGPR